MTTSSPEAPSLEPRSNPKTWAFWRARLARALLVGGFALAAIRLLPGLPHDQHLLFVAPEDSTIRSLDLVWRDGADGSVLGGATLNPSVQAPRLSHRISVPHGQYALEITARMDPVCTSAPCEQADEARGARVALERPIERTLKRTVELTGETARVMLTDR